MGNLWPVRKERKKVPMELRLVIAANLRQAMDAALDEDLKKAVTLGERAEVGRRTVNRLLNPEEYEEHGPELASLVAVAHTLRLEPWELLVQRRQPMLRGNIRTGEEAKKFHEVSLRKTRTKR